jgi:hypothetical protein
MTIDCLNALEQLVQFDLPSDGRLTPQLRWVRERPLPFLYAGASAPY